MNLEGVLKEYGLKEKEAKVYLSALQLGSAPVTKIAVKAALPRSTTYVILEALQDKGLTSSFRKKSIKWFSAQDPKTVIELGKRKLGLFEQALPQFLATYNTAKIKPDVRFYKGKEGIHLILEEILSEAKELRSFSSTEDLFKQIENYPDFVKRRVAKRIPCKVIARESAKARERKSIGHEQLRQMKLIPADFEYHGTMYIWRNKIATFSFGKEVYSLVIESEEMMNVQKSMFEVIWRILPN